MISGTHYIHPHYIAYKILRFNDTGRRKKKTERIHLSKQTLVKGMQNWFIVSKAGNTISLSLKKFYSTQKILYNQEP